MLPAHIAAQVARNPSLLPLRLEFFDPPQILWRAVPNIEHSTLCRAFGLDVMCWFDVPESFRAQGAQRVGAGRHESRRECSGFVFRGPKGTDPIAKIAIVRDSDRFRDRDLSRADFERLGDTA